MITWLTAKPAKVPRTRARNQVTHLTQVMEQAYLLSERLERLSADSSWAHKASGLRGSLLKSIDRIETARRYHLEQSQNELDDLAELMEAGFIILENAALEIVA